MYVKKNIIYQITLGSQHKRLRYESDAENEHFMQGAYDALSKKRIRYEQVKACEYCDGAHTPVCNPSNTEQNAEMRSI